MKEKLSALPVSELREIAKEKGIKGVSTLRKQQLVDMLAELDSKDDGITHKDEVPNENGETTTGILEVCQDGYGFLRSDNYLSGDDDVYVAQSQIRRFRLKTGDYVTGRVRPKREGENFGAIYYVDQVNGESLDKVINRPSFDDLTPVFPHERISLETDGHSIAMRMVDLICPIGKGQRGMIVSPPKAGKTTLLKETAKAVLKNNPEMEIIILLILEIFISYHTCICIYCLFEVDIRSCILIRNI